MAVTFHLTHACNLRCSYCYTGEKIHVGMSPDTAEEAIQFTLREAKLTNVTVIDIIFFGGEPLLKRSLLYSIVDRFNELLASDSAMKATYKLSTNGILLKKDVMVELANRKIYVSVSLDGAPEVHDAHRVGLRGEPTSQQLQHLIPEWLEWNPCMNVTCVVIPSTASKLDESVDWLVAQGFHYVTVTLDYSADWSSQDFKQLEKALKRLATIYERWHLKNKKVFVSCLDVKIQSHTRINMAACRCSFGISEFSISPSGRLYPCVQFVQEDDTNDYVIGSIQDGFDADKRAYLKQQSQLDKSECTGCAIVDRCSKWCTCINYASTGTLTQASPVLCEYERIAVPIADKLAHRLWKKRNHTFIHKQYNPSFPILNFIENLVLEDASDATYETTKIDR
ncbi:radical SAM/SPASM domain-containing protein [Lentimonas sp. CC19]|nr:radical SAM protein [Lentimonas sp. CC19]